MGIYAYPRTYSHATKTYSYAKSGNISLSTHFKLGEFRSKDKADEIVICPDLINLCLEKLFTWMPNVKAINITSGYRSIAHSKAVGGSGATDNHHLGMAADIKVKKTDGTFYSPKEVACALQDNGWEGGIGLMSSSLHVDTGSKYYFDETKKSGGAYVQVADWHKYTGITTNYKVATSAPAPVDKLSGAKQTVKTSKPAGSNGHKGTAYILTVDSLNVRSRASINSLKVGKYYRGQTFYVIRWVGAWAQLESGNWMCARNRCRKA